MMFCSAAFDCLELYIGTATPCCWAWLDEEFRILEHRDGPIRDPWALWNHPRLVRLRERILAGDYSQCQNCAVYKNGRDDPLRPEHKPVMQRGPVWVNWGNTQTCNLACPSCRPRKIDDTATEQDAFFRACNDAWLDGAVAISMNHNGDPFASPAHRQWLLDFDPKRYPNLGIRLTTNGLLLPRYWPALQRAWPAIRWIWISVDAASEETYRKVRGGDWDTLQDAAEIASQHCRRIGGHLQFHFVVQPANYREATLFAHWALGLGGRAEFWLIFRTWHSPEGFAAVNIGSPDHPEHEAMLDAFRDPVFREPRVTVDPEIRREL